MTAAASATDDAVATTSICGASCASVVRQLRDRQRLVLYDNGSHGV